MLQEREVVPLMERLLQDGYGVLLETSGERPLQRVPAKWSRLST
jgi:7-carboxy-7-deazaguanine synthase